MIFLKIIECIKVLTIIRKTDDNYSEIRWKEFGDSYIEI